MWKTLSRWATVLLWTASAAFAQLGNMSGDWYLNVEHSRWGQMRKPISVVLHITHHEPYLKYSGEVLYANEDVRDFSFDGAVDGKEHAMTRSFGPGRIIIHRVDLTTILSVMKSDDGQYVETARTSMTQDGKRMTRSLRLQSPEGVKTWTEIYEKH